MGRSCDEAGVDLVATWKRIEERARVSHLLIDENLCVSAAGIFKVAVAIDDLVSLNHVFDGSNFRFGRTGRCRSVFSLDRDETAAQIKNRKKTINKREPPSIDTPHFNCGRSRE